MLEKFLKLENVARSTRIRQGISGSHIEAEAFTHEFLNHKSLVLSQRLGAVGAIAPMLWKLP